MDRSHGSCGWGASTLDGYIVTTLENTICRFQVQTLPNEETLAWQHLPTLGYLQGHLEALLSFYSSSFSLHFLTLLPPLDTSFLPSSTRPLPNLQRLVLRKLRDYWDTKTTVHQSWKGLTKPRCALHRRKLGLREGLSRGPAYRESIATIDLQEGLQLLSILEPVPGTKPAMFLFASTILPL